MNIKSNGKSRIMLESQIGDVEGSQRANSVCPILIPPKMGENPFEAGELFLSEELTLWA